jgi:hypothetical protein
MAKLFKGPWVFNQGHSDQKQANARRAPAAALRPFLG